jgi:hypothetical protein
MKKMYEHKRVVVVVVNYRHGRLLTLGNIHVVTKKKPAFSLGLRKMT